MKILYDVQTLLERHPLTLSNPILTEL